MGLAEADLAAVGLVEEGGSAVGGSEVVVG